MIPTLIIRAYGLFSLQGKPIAASRHWPSQSHPHHSFFLFPETTAVLGLVYVAPYPPGTIFVTGLSQCGIKKLWPPGSPLSPPQPLSFQILFSSDFRLTPACTDLIFLLSWTSSPLLTAAGVTELRCMQWAWVTFLHIPGFLIYCFSQEISGRILL